MADFNIRSDSVDVEQIMAQIRARIQEKRGVDYTEEQVRELASVRLEKFLDPKNLRSDLLEQFKRSRPALPQPPKDPPPIEPPFTFDDETLFQTHRGSLRLIRRLLRPVLKLFFNPNTLNQILHKQSQLNLDLLKRDQRRKIESQLEAYSFARSRAEWNVLYYEVLHNLVVETTRNGIELKNLKMRVEALAGRLDFSERRVRALEGVVQYRPEIVRPRPAAPREGQSRPAQGRLREDQDAPADGEHTPARPEPAGTIAGDTAGGLGGEQSGRRRRRRRRGRRGSGGIPGSPVGSAGDQPLDGGAGDEDFEGGEDDDLTSDAAMSPEASEENATDRTPNAAITGASDQDPAARRTADAEPTRNDDLNVDDPKAGPSDPHAQ